MPSNVHPNILCNWSHVNEYFKFDGRMDRCKIFKSARSKLYFLTIIYFVNLQFMKWKIPQFFISEFIFVCDYIDILTLSCCLCLFYIILYILLFFTWTCIIFSSYLSSWWTTKQFDLKIVYYYLLLWRTRFIVRLCDLFIFQNCPRMVS